MGTRTAEEVFTPGSFPTHSYVARDDAALERDLRDGLATPGMAVSVSGPSKSGKTVLVEKVVGSDNLITVSGAGVRSASDLWDRVLDWMGAPSTSTHSTSLGGTVGASGEVSAKGGIPFVAAGSAKGTLSTGATMSAGDVTAKGRAGRLQVVREVANSSFVIFVDDFHYIDVGAQFDVAREIKAAVGEKVKVVVASVPHRSDDVVRANPELRGRVMKVDLSYWGEDQLVSIAEVGLAALGAAAPRQELVRLAREAAGSPQLMQSICLELCRDRGLLTASDTPLALQLDPDAVERICRRAARTIDFSTLFDALETGPKVRGQARKEFQFADGTRGDVYVAIVRAIAADPPSLTLKYDQLLDRLRHLCEGDPPSGSSVTGSCSAMKEIAEDKFPRERVLDWDSTNDVLEIVDPYLLFYLRWSGRTPK